MLTPVDKNGVNKLIRMYAIRLEKALVYYLEYLVAELTNHAKENAEYDDQTSNLKSSIGGVVLKDGRPIEFNGFDGAGAKGPTTGMDFLNDLILQNQNGYVIILVAGMEYATYVENYHNLNVLKKSELRMNSELPKILAKVKSKL